MQACLYSGELNRQEFREFFPGMNPGDLPFAGRSICRHMVDLCSSLNVSEVLLADYFFNPELAEHLGDGAYWSLRLQYINCERCGTLRAQLALRENFKEQDDEILIFRGMVLPDIHRTEELFRELREVDPDQENPENGVYLFRNGTFHECVCPLYRCDSLKSYFDINFRLLHDPGIYSLPGYSPQAGFGIGRNVPMRPDCDVQKPVLILDDVFLDSGVKLKNGVIIGQYVLIDEHSELDHTIVLDNTYIGRNMLLRNKIVCGNRVYDPETDSYIDLDDDYLAKNLSSTKNGQQCMPMERMFALLLAVFELPLFLATLLGGRFLGDMPFPHFLRKNYLKFWKVVAGRAQLVRFGSRQNDYVFRYSDLWWPIWKSEFQKNLGDMYYYRHRSFTRLAAVAVWSQLKRMLTRKNPFPEEETR